KRSKACCLVIDASIAKAAGTSASSDPIGIRCSDFLIAVRGLGYRMAWSEAIKAEWDNHQSPFAAAWLVTMANRRKLRPVKDEPMEELRAAIEGHSNKNVARIMLKDAHLIEAALAADSRVASGDESARGHFGRLAATFALLRRIIWINPALEDEQAVEWLKVGAPAKRSRRLKP